MRRSSVLAFALLATANCAHAQGARDEAAARAVANVMLAAMPEEQQGAWGYRWDAVSIRVSPLVRWHIYAPDPRERETNTIVERHGWLEGDGFGLGVTVRGVDAQVTELSLDVDRFPPSMLLDVLRESGAAVSFEGDDESSMYYWVRAPGRAGSRLALTRTCSSPQSAAAQHCEDVATVQFEVQ